ncbi:pur operon repressor [Exiguobacterium flavidum]|uniref:pur operon repressor n=1 Tax=Exiguobacterium flavidum TaxID=2184695 RepID=UPI000DF725B0|nr:pur operon repressor [Exiguobacterium flavidum]
MKIRRSGRLVDMTRYLLDHPHQLVSLTMFSERYKSAKSSISEDLDIVSDMLEQEGTGKLVTVPGAAGGVMFIPTWSSEKALTFIDELCERVARPDRLLPGGYLYLTDLLGDPRMVKQMGQVFASVFSQKKVDVVMTIATKGIPLAYAVAEQLGVPFVIVRSDSRVTEGSTVSINYVSGSSKAIRTMALARRSLPRGANVLLIDDFMKAGGTIRGMMSLLSEFEAKVAGVGVLIEAEGAERKMVSEYVSLMRLADVDVDQGQIHVHRGNAAAHFE